MAVVIKDIYIPTYCSKCEFKKVKNYKGYCERTGSELMYGDLFNARPSDCPIVEIGTCKDCRHREGIDLDSCFCAKHGNSARDNFYCADFEEYDK